MRDTQEPKFVSSSTDIKEIDSFKLLINRNVRELNDFLEKYSISIPPEKLIELQESYIKKISKIWSSLTSEDKVPISDRRFASPDWNSNLFFYYISTIYLLNSEFIQRLSDTIEADPKIKQKIKFSIQQIIEAGSPANYLITNPEAQRKIIETNGESLTHGMINMLIDMRKGRISMTDESAFSVGESIANTEGGVVYENKLIQLIQYNPVSKEVFERPILMVPPCINKYYILDLKPENSLVKYLVNNGHTVFMISWRNPDIALCNLTWDDYIKSGIIQSINVVKDISGQNKINCFGFCVGGTLLSCALAALAKKNINPTASLTLITTFLDFYDTGILDVYVDEVQVALHEQAIGKGGLLPGRELAMTFSSLRPNDLIWPYVQSNYLKGEDPDPFDLLFWNSDSTNLPGPMFCWYLRNAYLENKLCQPNEVNVVGEGLDFSLIDTPCFIYASKDDHIVPWKSAYANLSILNVDKPEKNKFILGASGHIAGVINSPIKNKRCYWESNTYSKNSEQWFQSAKEVKGSWWPAWLKFLNSYAGDSGKPSLKLGNSRYNVIEAAPGNYVKSTCN